MQHGMVGLCVSHIDLTVAMSQGACRLADPECESGVAVCLYEGSEVAMAPSDHCHAAAPPGIERRLPLL